MTIFNFLDDNGDDKKKVNSAEKAEETIKSIIEKSGMRAENDTIDYSMRVLAMIIGIAKKVGVSPEELNDFATNKDHVFLKALTIAKINTDPITDEQKNLLINAIEMQADKATKCKCPNCSKKK